MSDGGVEVVKAESEEVRRELEWLRETFSSSYGPWGGLLLLQGAGGGVATLTRHTPKLLQLIRAENPFSKAVISHLQGHAQTHRDSTLYAGILACNLVLHGLKLQLPRKKVAMEIGHTLLEVVSWLRGGDCEARRRLTFDTVDQLMHLLSSFLGAKLSMLSQQSLQHLCALLLKAFLRALPEGGGEKSISLSEHIYVVCVPHCPAPHLHPSLLSSLHNGLLLSLEGSPAVSAAGRGLGSEVKRTPQGTILTAVFQCSLAGDLPEGSEFNLVGVADVSVDDVMVEELMAVGRVLVERGVGLVACQKCVHPMLRDYLKAEGVLVLERLSSLLLEPVGALCGAQVLALATPFTVRQARLGVVTDLSSIWFEGQWYCQLQGGADKHSTLLLCSDSQHNLDDLQFFVRDAMKVFECCVGEPEVVCGGGCADTLTASYLRSKAKGGSLPGCELPKVVEMVAECFERQAVALEKHGGRVLTEDVFHHCWIFPPTPCCLQPFLCDATGNKTCNCGAVSLSCIPSDTTWTALGPDDLMLSPLSPHPAPPPPTVGVSVAQSFPEVCDLLSCRVSALTCVAELAQVLLNTAWVLVPHQVN